GLSDPYVKFKVNGRTVYKSKCCKLTLDPFWHEDFVTELDMACKVELRVYDRDRAFTDDFMGAAEIDLASLTPTSEEVNLHLADENLNEELGYINLHASVVATQVNSRLPHKLTVGCHAGIRGQRTIFPVAVATVQLVSGSNLPARDANGFSDPYVKFTMGKAKKKSKVCYKTLNPVWKDEFIFQLFNNESSTLDVTVWDKDNYRKDDFIGRCELNLWDIEREVTHSLQLGLLDTPGNLLFLITIHDIEPRENSLTSYDLSNLRTRYPLKVPLTSSTQNKTATFQDLPDVGFAELKVISATGLRAADINGKSDPFCVVQLCNARAQTQTCYKTLDPVWNRVFTFGIHFCFFNQYFSSFIKLQHNSMHNTTLHQLKPINSTPHSPIRDIHDVFDICIFDSDNVTDREFLGRVAIPILRGVNGVERTYALKDRKLKERTKGTVTIQISYIYNPIRAAIRTLSPREEKYMEEDLKFKKNLLLSNFQRVWRLMQSIIATAEFINSCFTWVNPRRSAVAFMAFLVIVWNFELYMLPISLLMLLMKTYVDVFVRNQPLAANDDDDVDEELSSNKPSLLQRLSALQEVLTKVQNILDFIASFGERVKNTFAWRVPFLSWLAVCVLCVVAVVLYYFPLRGIVLLWGINKFTKRLRKPNFVPNNEVMDFLSRVPSNVQIVS
uniref:C2 domain-containing protein n=1 Tax=Ciona savignyi TaxID=51511 RepID=H2Y6V8_CIOSA